MEGHERRLLASNDMRARVCCSALELVLVPSSQRGSDMERVFAIPASIHTAIYDRLRGTSRQIGNRRKGFRRVKDR